jgi:hypothetical protein
MSTEDPTQAAPRPVARLFGALGAAVAAVVLLTGASR